jgi:glycosyltransferase involved in cell wall biosynthesis
MQRVLHVTYSMNRGGLETFIMNVYRSINREKIQFDFLLFEGKSDYKNEILALGGRVYHIPSRRNSIKKHRLAIREFMQEHDEYNAVHLHASDATYLYPLAVAKACHKSVRIIHSHSTKVYPHIAYRILHLLQKPTIKYKANVYLACSKDAGKYLYAPYIGQNAIEVINNGIEIDKFLYNPVIREHIRRKLGLGNSLVVGNVARFSYTKNHTFLLDIFKRVKLCYANSMLLLVGDGENRYEIEKKIQALGISDSVILTGVRKDVPELFQAMDVFVLPSHYEGLPVTLVEAQASGLPCIVSTQVTKDANITGLIQYISLNTGIDKWAESIVAAYHSVDRCNQRKSIKDAGYDINEVAKRLSEIYTQ